MGILRSPALDASSPAAATGRAAKSGSTSTACRDPPLEEFRRARLPLASCPPTSLRPLRRSASVVAFGPDRGWTLAAVWYMLLGPISPGVSSQIRPRPARTGSSLANLDAHTEELPGEVGFGPARDGLPEAAELLEDKIMPEDEKGTAQKGCF